jgi:hypothetical protein
LLALESVQPGMLGTQPELTFAVGLKLKALGIMQPW